VCVKPNRNCESENRHLVAAIIAATSETDSEVFDKVERYEFALELLGLDADQRCEAFNKRQRRQ
jgi:hypothetical protein